MKLLLITCYLEDYLALWGPLVAPKTYFANLPADCATDPRFSLYLLTCLLEILYLMWPNKNFVRLEFYQISKLFRILFYQ